MKNKKLAFVSAAMLTLSMAGTFINPVSASSETNLNVVYWPGPESDAFQQVVNRYNATQGLKDHIHVNLLLFSRVGTYTKEDSMMSSKSSAADLWYAASYNIGQYSAYMNPLPGKINKSLFIPSAVKSLTVNGKWYVLPMDVSNHFLFYRKDLIHKLLTDSAWKKEYAQISKQVVGKALQPKQPSQWSWNDFMATAAFFTQSKNPSSPTQYGTFMQMENLIYNVMIWDDVLWSYGGNWLKPNGTPAFDTKAAKEALQLYQNIYKDGFTPSSSSTSEYPQTNAALETGNAAFAIQWSAAYSELTDKSKDQFYNEIGVAPVPGGKTHIHAMGVAINKYSTHQAQDVKFLKYLASTSAMKQYAIAGGIPPVESVLNSLSKQDAEFPLISKTVKENVFSEPPLKQEQNVLQVLAQDLSGAWANQTSVQQALSQAQSDVANVIGK